MGDFHIPEVQQFPNSNATIGFKSNPIATSNRRYAKQSVLYSTVTVVFAKNYLKHSKVNGMCVKSSPVLASSRVKAVMKWWSKCISMAIAKTASRNVAFKSGKMMDALFQGQSMAHTL